jgi:hypothetical protein
MANICPVCGYPELHFPPRKLGGGHSFEICRSCGFQFGVSDDDRGISYEQWRKQWVANKMPWSSVTKMPAGWDPKKQLENLNNVRF